MLSKKQWKKMSQLSKSRLPYSKKICIEFSVVDHFLGRQNCFFSLILEIDFSYALVFFWIFLIVLKSSSSGLS